MTYFPRGDAVFTQKGFDMLRLIARNRRGPVLLMVGLLMLVGCAMPSAEQSAPTGTDANVQVSLLPAPEGKDGDHVTVEVTDADGMPITDAQVAVVGNMSHAGMVPVEAPAVTDDADGAADGRYVLPFTFTMLGDWVMTVTVTLADGTTVTQDIDATVSDTEVTVGGVPSDAVSLTGVWARPVPTAGGTGGVFMTIHNTTAQDDTLIGGSSPIAQAVEVHETVDDNGMMRMQQLTDGLPVPAGSTVVLQPGGYHIMVIGVDAALDEGATIPLTLTFAVAGEMTVDVPVMSMDMDMSGMDSGN